MKYLPVQKGKRFSKITVYLVVLMVTIQISGCANKRILDENAMSFVVGYDLHGKDMVRGTVVYPVINPFAQEKIQVISGVNRTSKGLRDVFDLQMDKKPVAGQLRISLYNEELARKGIMQMVDALYRDPSVGTRLYLGIVEKDCYSLLTKPFKEEGNIGNYLFELLDHNIREERIPSSTMHEFLRSYYSEVSDPALPLFTLKGDEAIIKGVAILQKDKMVGWISPREAFLMKLIINRFRDGDYQASIPAKRLTPKSSDGEKNVDVVLDTLSSYSRIRLVKDGAPEFKVKVGIKARILEVSRQVNLGDERVLSVLSDEIGKEIEQGLLQLTQKLKKMKADPIGFGDYFHAYSKHEHPQGEKITREDWQQIYAKAKISYDVKVELLRSGTID